MLRALGLDARLSRDVLGTAAEDAPAQAEAATADAAGPDGAQAGGALLVTGVFRREGALWT